MTSKTMGAGSGPKVLAQARRRRSSLLKVVAIGLLIALIPIALIWNTFPLWAYILLLIAARVCNLYSTDFQRSARRADRGSQAERAVASRLSQLPSGWKVEAGIFFEGFGDIDFFLTSPTGKAFVIDVKSHYGGVNLAPDGSRLMRVIDGAMSEFDHGKDILKSVRGQANRISQERNIPFVMPVLAFTRAKVLCEHNRIGDVTVIEVKELVELLKEIETSTP